MFNYNNSLAIKNIIPIRIVHLLLNKALLYLSSMKSRSLPIFLILTCFFTQSFGQNHVIDSLRKTLETKQNDTDKVNTLNKLCEKLWRLDKCDSSIPFANSAKTLAEKLGYKKGIAKAYINLAYINKRLEDYPKSVGYFSKALKIYEELEDKGNIAMITGNIGIIFDEEGDYPKTLDCFLKTLKIYEELGDKARIADYSGNIGTVYLELGDYSKSLDFDFKALKMDEEMGNKDNIALNKARIGNVYEDQGDYPKALANYFSALKMDEDMSNNSGIAMNIENIANVYDLQKNYNQSLNYSFKSLKIYEALGDKSNVETVLGNMGSVYKDMGDLNNAMVYSFKALNLSRQLGDKSGIALNTGNIGSIYTIKKRYGQAKVFLDSALAISTSIGDKELIKSSYSSIALLDSITGHYKEGWKNYREYILYRDSITDEATTRKIMQAQMNYDFDRKTDSAKAAQEQLNLITEKESQKQKVILNSFIIGFILMNVLAFLIFRGYKQKQKANITITKQKEEVENQKALVEEKNKDILDSIMYAKRLQEAILPPLNLIKKSLPQSFVLYKPKDIVSGDFYWMEQTADTILIAAADCTGHGVPGALVSVICSNALNRTVKEFLITEPGKILDKVRELVLETFEKSENNVQDGMDISLCCINTNSKEIQWSGAYNPLWYIQNGEVKELLADKQPIGKHDRPMPFSTHAIKLHEGDVLYLFTDGYADQFGGPKGKKFKYKQLEELLLSNNRKPMEEQKNLLEDALEKWKGSLEQVDDILIIGIMV